MADKTARITEQAGKEGADAASDMAGAVSEAASRYAKQARDYAQQGYEAAAEKSQQIKESTEGYITENPWYAVGIALGVGVLLGLLLRSRD